MLPGVLTRQREVAALRDDEGGVLIIALLQVRGSKKERLEGIRKVVEASAAEEQE